MTLTAMSTSAAKSQCQRRLQYSGKSGSFIRNGSSERWVDQIVLLKGCRQEVLKLAQSIPIAGHLGKMMTRFYWPIYPQDMANF